MQSFRPTTGEVYRVLPASGFSELGNTPNVTWNAVCRVSDTEGWVVGTGLYLDDIDAAMESIQKDVTKGIFLEIGKLLGITALLAAAGAFALFRPPALRPVKVPTRPVPWTAAAVLLLFLSVSVRSLAGDSLAGPWRGIPAMAWLPKWAGSPRV